MSPYTTRAWRCLNSASTMSLAAMISRRPLVVTAAATGRHDRRPLPTATPNEPYTLFADTFSAPCRLSKYSRAGPSAVFIAALASARAASSDSSRRGTTPRVVSTK